MPLKGPVGAVQPKSTTDFTLPVEEVKQQHHQVQKL